jgi:transposase-like protein
LRGWSYGEVKDIEPLFGRGPFACGANGVGTWRDHASQWAAIGSIAAKIGCTAETLRGWVRQAERDQGLRAGPTSDERERIKALEREVRELRQANEILRKASAYFAMAELDRRSKP